MQHLAYDIDIIEKNKGNGWVYKEKICQKTNFSPYIHINSYTTKSSLPLKAAKSSFYHSLSLDK